MIDALVRTGLARFEFRHAQFNFGTEIGALATECAADQGAFWDFYDSYVGAAPPQPPEDGPSLFSREGAVWLAERLSLDADQLANCVDEQTHLPAIEASLQRAFREATGPDGWLRTPALLINGQLFLDWSNLEAIVETVQREHAAVSGN